MPVCLACYGSRLSSLFESTDDFRLYAETDGSFTPQGLINLAGKSPEDKASALAACGVEVLICGAVSRCTRMMLERSGIRVLCWIRGDVDQVLEAFSKGDMDGLALPGCRGPRRCGPGGNGPEGNRPQGGSPGGGRGAGGMCRRGGPGHGGGPGGGIGPGRAGCPGPAGRGQGRQGMKKDKETKS